MVEVARVRITRTRGGRRWQQRNGDDDHHMHALPLTGRKCATLLSPCRIDLSVSA